MSKYQISATGAWLFEGGHKFDASLADAIRETLIGALTIIDIGCGDGTYTRYLTDCGYNVQGYDGNPDTEAITRGLCKVADFSQPQDFGKFDAVLCLEVGEHVPAEYEHILLDNIASHAKGIVILSWAVPGQGGHGHVNERKNGWVIDEMDDRNFSLEYESTAWLREHVSSCYWFKNTVMAFARVR